MNEHQFIDYLREQAKLNNSISLEKVHGGPYAKGKADLWYTCPQGNFKIEMKFLQLPTRSDTTVNPFGAVTALQWNDVKRVWAINGCAAIGVGFAFGGFLYCKFFPPVEGLPPWYPHQEMNSNVFAKRGHHGTPWPWDRFTEELVKILKFRHSVH